VRDIERKRAYDRERMARLHAEGRTWWQQRGRNDYDMLRGMLVRPMERHAAVLGDDGSIAEGKETVRRMFASSRERERFVAEHGECEYNDGSRVERSGPFKMTIRPCSTRLSHAEVHAAARRVVNEPQVVESQVDEEPVEMPDPMDWLRQVRLL
jgi:hypothetical protein